MLALSNLATPRTSKLLFPGVIPIPTLFDNVVILDLFHDEIHVVALFNVVLPDIFNVDLNNEGLIYCCIIILICYCIMI